ncbi:MAG: DUF2834 domain-containing protein [Rhodobacteraceae bacterium]|nr:DUF2834 domain-containing protein [Paracoccaceae bacterium]
MSVLRMIYLALAIIGAIVPMMFFVPWALEGEASLAALIAAWKANAATTGLYYDMLIAALALNVWVLAETYVRRDWWVLICLPATYLIGLSCGLPLFLFLRSRPVI